MRFEPTQSTGIYGPLLLEQALVDVPLFGPKKEETRSAVEQMLQSDAPAEEVETRRSTDSKVSAGPTGGQRIAERLMALRKAVRSQNEEQGEEGAKSESNDAAAEQMEDKLDRLTLAEKGLVSSRRLHESILSILPQATKLTPEAQSDVDHVMLHRAKERYLFDPVVNRSVVADDLWLKYLWDWIAGQSFRTQFQSDHLGLMLYRCRGCGSRWDHEPSPLRPGLHGRGFDMEQ